jgi:quinol-cytochrome oxidoreductase complex cytochrome b subunit
MRAAKVIGLGIFFSFGGFIILLFISIVRGGVSGGTSVETSHATALSAVVAGMIEALFSPITLLVIVVAFVAAFLLVGRSGPKGVTTYSNEI